MVCSLCAPHCQDQQRSAQSFGRRALVEGPDRVCRGLGGLTRRSQLDRMATVRQSGSGRTTATRGRAAAHVTHCVRRTGQDAASACRMFDSLGMYRRRSEEGLHVLVRIELCQRQVDVERLLTH